MIPIKVVTPEEAEKCDFVVCGDKAAVAGAYEAKCSKCSAKVFVAPSSPVKPPKICLSCYASYLIQKLSERNEQSFPA